MADPVYVNSSNAGFTSPVTSHTISYSGYTIAANDLFVLNLVCNSASATVTLPSGWTQLFSYDIDGSGTSGKHEVWYKGAAGASTTSEAWTTSSASAGAHTLTQYRDARLDVDDTPARVRGTGIFPDPPEFGIIGISPGSTVFTVGLAAWDSGASVSSYPSTFGTGQQEGGILSSRCASASKGSIGGQNPGAYTISTSSDWSAATLLIRYDAAGQPDTSTGPADVDIDLNTITSDCEFIDFTPATTFVELPTIIAELSPQDTQFQFLANLETIEAVADFSNAWTFLSNPVILETITADAEFRDASDLIAINVDLPTITADAEFNSLETGRSVELPTITAELAYQTQLGAYRLSKNRTKKIDMSSALFDLQLLPPLNMTEGDFFAVVLVAGGSRSMNYSINTYKPLLPMHNEGDFAVWQQVGSKILVVDSNIQRTTEEITSDYTALPNNKVILADATSGAIDITLPACAAMPDYSMNIKKMDATGNAITITPEGSETIDGASSRSLSSQYANLTIYSDGTEWLIL